MQALDFPDGFFFAGIGTIPERLFLGAGIGGGPGDFPSRLSKLQLFQSSPKLLESYLAPWIWGPLPRDPLVFITQLFSFNVMLYHGV